MLSLKTEDHFTKSLNFSEIQDKTKPIIKTILHKIHVGSSASPRRLVTVKNHKVSIEINLKNCDLPAIIIYEDLNNQKIATVYCDKNFCFLKCENEDVKIIDMVFKSSFKTGTLFFDYPDKTINLLGRAEITSQLIIQAKEVTICPKAHITTKETFIKANHITHKGTLQSDGDYLIHCQHYHHTVEGQVSVKKIASINATIDYLSEGEVISKGSYHVNGKHIALNGKHVCDELNINGTSILVGARAVIQLKHNSVLNAKDIKLERKSKILASQPLELQIHAEKSIHSAAIIHAERLFMKGNKLFFKKASSIVTKEFRYHADMISHHGECLTEKGIFEAEKKLTLSQHSVIRSKDNVYFKAKNIHLDNHSVIFAENLMQIAAEDIGLQQSQLHSNGKVIISATNIHANNLNQLHAKQILIHGKLVHLDNTIVAEDAQIKAETDITLTAHMTIARLVTIEGVTVLMAHARVSSDIMIIKGNDIQVNDVSLYGKQSIIFNGKTLTFDENSTIDSPKVNAKANNMTFNESEFTVQSSHFDGNRIQLKEGNRINGDNVHFKARILALNNKVQVKRCTIQADELVKFRQHFLGDIHQLVIKTAKLGFSGTLDSVNECTMQASESVVFAEMSLIRFRKYLAVNCASDINVLGQIYHDKSYVPEKSLSEKVEPQGYLALNGFNISLNSIIECYSCRFGCQGDLNVMKNASLTSTMPIIAIALNIHLDGALNSRDIAILNATHQITASKNASVEAEKALECHAHAITCHGSFFESRILTMASSHIEANERAVFKASKVMYLHGESSNLKTTNAHKTQGKLCKINNGVIDAGELHINYLSYYHKSGSVAVKHNWVLESQNAFFDIPCSAQNANFNIKAESLISYQGMLTIAECLKYHAGTTINNGYILSHFIMDLDNDTYMANHQTGHIALLVDDLLKEKNDKKGIKPFFRIQGGRFWNAGSVKAMGCDIVFSLNGVFVAGFSEKSGLKEMARGCFTSEIISTENISILAGAILCTGGSLTAKNINVTALVNILFCKMAVDINGGKINSQALIKIDAGLVLPSLASMGRLFSEVSKGDFTGLTRSLFTEESACTAVNLFITGLKFVAPLAGQGASILWNSIMIARQFPLIVQMCRSIYQKGRDHIQMRDFYPLIIMGKNAISQGVSSVSAACSLSGEFITPDSAFMLPEFEVHTDTDTLISLASTMAMTFAPGVNDESLISINLPGLTVTGTQSTTTLFTLKTPGHVEAAGVINDQFYQAQLLSHQYAYAMTMTGNNLNLGGSTKSKQIAINISEEVHILTDLKVSQGYLSAKELKQSADLILEHSDVKVAHHSIDKGRTLSLDGAIYESGQTDNKGHVIAQNSVYTSHHYHNHSGATTKAEHSKIEMDELDNAQYSVLSLFSSEFNSKEKVNNSGHVDMAETNATANNITVNLTGDLTATQSRLAADTMQVDGTFKAKQAELALKNNTIGATGFQSMEAVSDHTEKLTNQGVFNIEGSRVTADVSDLSGITTIDKSEFEFNTLETTRGSSTVIKDSLMTGNNRDKHHAPLVDGQDGTMISPKEDAIMDSKMTIDGDFRAQRTAFDVDDINILENGNAHIEEVVFTGNHLTLSNQASLTTEVAKLTFNKLTLDKLSSIHLVQTEVDLIEDTTLSGTVTTKETTVTVKGKVTFDGKANMTETVVKSGKTMTVTKTAELKAKNTQLESEKDINFEGKGVVSQTVMLKAKENINTSYESSFTKSGHDTVLILDSEGGDLKGSVNIDTVYVKNNAITNVYDFLAGMGQYSHFQPTGMLQFETNQAVTLNQTLHRNIGLSVIAESITVNKSMSSEGIVSFKTNAGNITLNANVTGKEGLYVDSANDIITDSHMFSSEETTFFNSHGNVTNNGGSIYGKQTFISSDHDVYNNGGVFYGSNYLQVNAAGSIYNTCLEYNVQGAYDIVKSYQPAQMIGGMGTGYEGVGLYVHAGDKVYNDASLMGANGLVYIYGNKGVVSTPRAHTYVSYHKKKKGSLGFHKKETTIIDTQVQNAVIESTDSRVIMSSDKGDITLVATNVLSREGADIFTGEGNIDILDLITLHSIEKQKSSWWGVNKNKYSQSDESSLPTVIANVDPGYTRINAGKGSVHLQGAVIQAPGSVTINASESVLINQSTLHHKIEIMQQGFDFSAYGMHLAGNKNQSPLVNGDPTYQHFNQLLHGHGTDEFALNALSTTTELIQTANVVSTALESGHIVSALSDRYLGGLFKPQIHLGYEKSKSISEFETLSNGIISTDDLSINAGKITIEGVPIYAAHDFDVTADNFEIKGVALHSSFKSQTDSYSIDLTPDSIYKPDIGYGHGSNSMHSAQYATEFVYVGNNFHINAKTATISDAYVSTGSINGSVNVLNITSHTDTISSHGKAYHVNTNGSVEIQKNSSESATISTPTELNIRGDLTNEFAVNTVNLTAAKLTVEKDLDFNATVNVYDVNTFSKSSSFSASFNVNQVIDALRQTPEKNASHYKNVVNPKVKPEQQKLDKVVVSQDITIEKGIQHSVIQAKGSNHLTGTIHGNVITNSRDGYEITHKESHHRVAEIALPTAKNQRIIKESVEKITGMFQDKESDNIIKAAKQFTNIKDPKLAVAEIEKLRNLSNHVYDDDLGKKAAESLGLTLYDQYNDDATSTHVAVFVDEATNKAYIILRGTDGLTSVVTDDLNIITNQAISSVVNNPKFDIFINNVLDKLEDYDIILTAHSRGAAQASVISSEYDLNAIVFENPGLPLDDNYDLSKVLSFQSSEDLVTSFPKFSTHDNDYGTVILLPETEGDAFKNIILSMTGNMKNLGLLSGLTHLSQTHALNNVGDRVHDTLQHALVNRNQVSANAVKTRSSQNFSFFKATHATQKTASSFKKSY